MKLMLKALCQTCMIEKDILLMSSRKRCITCYNQFFYKKKKEARKKARILKAKEIKKIIVPNYTFYTKDNIVYVTKTRTWKTYEYKKFLKHLEYTIKEWDNRVVTWYQKELYLFKALYLKFKKTNDKSI